MGSVKSGNFTPKTKYLKKYCNMLIEHMKEGYSFETFGATIGVARTTLYRWADEHADFKAAKDLAFDHCQMEWERKGMEGMYMGGPGMPFQSSMWNFSMSARFGWSTKQEKTVDNTNIEIKIDDDDSAL